MRVVLVEHYKCQLAEMSMTERQRRDSMMKLGRQFDVTKRRDVGQARLAVDDLLELRGEEVIFVPFFRKNGSQYELVWSRVKLSMKR